LAILVKRVPSLKIFELTIPFTKINGTHFPLVDVSFFTIYNDWFTVPLIFDTGAEDVVLKPDYEHVFPAGKVTSVGGIGGAGGHDAIETQSKVEFLGRQISKCSILIDKVPAPALIGGVAGRQIFKSFGFGFWENARELYVSLSPS
jgi:hypothetical protein